MEEGVYLRRKISNELWDTYNKKFQEYYKKWIEARDKGDQAKFKVKIDQVVKIMKNLKSTPFKNNVMKESMEVFYDEKFNKKIDANPWLIGFQNGIYDLKTNTFRDGNPSDYISMKMAVEYDEMMSETDSSVCEVYDFFSKNFS